jgi:hypothetical protein
MHANAKDQHEFMPIKPVSPDNEQALSEAES